MPGKPAFVQKKKMRPVIFAKMQKRRAAFVHNMRLDIIPLIEYNKIRYWQKGQAQYEVFIDL